MNGITRHISTINPDYDYSSTSEASEDGVAFAPAVGGVAATEAAAAVTLTAAALLVACQQDPACSAQVDSLLQRGHTLTREVLLNLVVQYKISLAPGVAKGTSTLLKFAEDQVKKLGVEETWRRLTKNAEGDGTPKGPEGDKTPRPVPPFIPQGQEPESTTKTDPNPAVSDRFIMVVDDEPGNLRVAEAKLKRVAQSKKLAIKTFENPIEALSAARDTSKVACVLSDQDMPMLLGLDLLSSLDRMGVVAPKALGTGNGSAAEQAKKIGIQVFIKPLNWTDVQNWASSNCN